MSEDTDPIRTTIEMMRTNWPEASADRAAVVISVHRMARLLQRTAQDALQSVDLNPSEFELLSALRTRSPPHRLTPSDLYTAMLMSSGGLTKLLKGLEVRGLVLRPQSAGDGRSRPIELSEEGRIRVEAAMKIVQGAEEPLMRAMKASFTSVREMSRMLVALAIAAEEADKKEHAND